MIIGIIIIWAALVASVSDTVTRWPALVQLIFYISAGVVWILPCAHPALERDRALAGGPAATLKFRAALAT
jgi:hypothetical protein